MENKIWILAEVFEDKLSNVSFELLARAHNLKNKLQDSEIVSIVLYNDLSEDELAKLFHYGSDKIIFLKHNKLKNFIVDDYTRVLVNLINREKPAILLGAATTFGRTILPYVATKVYAGLTADCTILDIEEETGNLLQTRPAIGGNILATIKTPIARPQMATIRPHSTKPLKPDTKKQGELIIENVKDDFFKSSIEFIKFEKEEGDEKSITDSRIVVAGGKGFAKAENFKYLHQLAKILDAGIGASREAVDRGWISYPHQVGLSGKTITPDLYIAIGISGAIQHLAGMQTSKHIIAINNDPDAQIFKLADLAIVGNLFDILPELINKLSELKGE